MFLYSVFLNIYLFLQLSNILNLNLSVFRFLETSQHSQENICARVSILIKLQPQASNFIKIESLVEVLSCEFCKISKNTFSYRTPLVAVSVSLDHWPRL